MKTDREILRELAKQYTEIAFSEENFNNIKRHKGCNDLKQLKPIVLMDELPWQELNADNVLTLVKTNFIAA